MGKTFTVVGNWKMYKTARQATDYIETLLPLIEDAEVNVYLAVPYTSIHSAAQYAKGSKVVIGAQNMNDVREGAFTGEIASLMLKEAGAAFVLLGHSERRLVFKEDDLLIHKKVLRALADDMRPILCIGESLAHHKKGESQDVLYEQIQSALKGIPKEEAAHLIVAYEPIWAIGSGKTPESEQIQEVHGFIRETLSELFGKKIVETIPILYGGSVQPENVFEIAKGKNVDGVLVGGASLDPQKFSKIIHNIARQSTKKPTRTKKEKKL